MRSSHWIMCAKTRVSERTVSSFCSLTACMNVNTRWNLGGNGRKRNKNNNKKRSLFLGPLRFFVQWLLSTFSRQFYITSISRISQGKVIYRTYSSYIHCPPKVWKRPRQWGFGQYWHESFLICDNFALIRDNTNYENILLHKQFIHRIFFNFRFIKISTISSYYSSA